MKKLTNCQTALSILTLFLALCRESVIIEKRSIRLSILLSFILTGFCSYILNAQPEYSHPDFSMFAKKYPWEVSKELIENKSPGSVAETYFDEALVSKYTLPEILILNNGKKVKTLATWEGQRREELLALFRSEVYGVSPPKPENLSFKIVYNNPMAFDGKATLKRIALTIHLRDEVFIFHLTMLVPNKRQGKAPLFLVLDHRKGVTTIPDSIPQSGYWPAEYLLSRGYALAVINVSDEVDPDFPISETGIRVFYREHYDDPGELNWGTISAWAWSASRAVDYFKTDPDIDTARIAVIGHSRGGKTSLWAGAQDTRFALVVPNNAGDGGPSIVRRRLGNTIEVMTGRNPHWFVPKYATYAQRENAMPVDQHMLIALVAPRGYHAGDGSEDLWHDPRGAWLALIDASKVWAMYGNAHQMKDKMPLVNDLRVNGPIAYHMRTGGHGLLLFDWKLYLDHADVYLKSNESISQK
jgi:dienelactone hydrolase